MKICSDNDKIFTLLSSTLTTRLIWSIQRSINFCVIIDNINAAKNTRDDSSTITVPVPFKDQKSANSVRRKCKFWAPTLVSQLNPLFTFRPGGLAKFSLLRANVPKNRPLTKPESDSGSDSGSDQISDRIRPDSGSDRIGSDWYLQNYYFWEKATLTMILADRIFFFRATCVSNKKNCFSCITSLQIHHQLENHRKELFSSKLHGEIFCCINSWR